MNKRKKYKIKLIKIRRERSFPLTNSQGARIDTSLVKRIEGEITKRKKNN